METLLTVIGLGNFLAIMAIVWKGGERIGTIETNIDWLKETVKDIANNQSIAKDNKRLNLIGNASPLRLKPEGERVLEASGMKEYIDSHESELHNKCGHNCDISAYEIQENVFDMFDGIEFDKDTDKKFKDYAFSKGMNMETIRRIGAIYFRDKCLKLCNLNHGDVDNTKP
ncbi:MAG: hypothetical protein H6779_02125 [Candidatus Nomurabacteria bacterium]|nr:hypothetical protein [Candidatus Nomurabacteria bacterium]USN88222.1 MAG: hypothetical protein H6779_02125 [Candidatus Nomurabacteria bacterium]